MAGICEHIHHLLALAPFAGFSTCRKTITSLSFIDNYYIGTHYETFDDATRDLRHFAYPIALSKEEGGEIIYTQNNKLVEYSKQYYKIVKFPEPEMRCYKLSEYRIIEFLY
jgi:hypothetical protein